MRHYQVFQRGDRYRVAAPTRFRWRWSRDVHTSPLGSALSWIFETDDQAEAQARANKLNAREWQRFNYSIDHWKAAA